jgi:UDP-3-O-[3-hydroxymyristoyl] glucosamine N-acyltransferase
VYAQSGVPASLAGGKKYFGSPVQEAAVKMKELVWIKRIPELWEKLKLFQKPILPLRRTPNTRL